MKSKIAKAIGQYSICYPSDFDILIYNHNFHRLRCLLWNINSLNIFILFYIIIYIIIYMLYLYLLNKIITYSRLLYDKM